MYQFFHFSNSFVLLWKCCLNSLRTKTEIYFLSKISENMDEMSYVLLMISEVYCESLIWIFSFSSYLLPIFSAKRKHKQAWITCAHSLRACFTYKRLMLICASLRFFFKERLNLFKQSASSIIKAVTKILPSKMNTSRKPFYLVEKCTYEESKKGYKRQINKSSTLISRKNQVH